MNFYLYDKVVISDGLAAHAYTREEYSSLGLFHYDNREIARFKVDYCVLRPGHFVSVCSGPDYVRDVGVLVTMLHHDEDIFLAYKLPASTICEDNPLLFFRRFKLARALNEDVLYLVPIHCFLKRSYVYPVDGQYYEVIV